MNDNLPRRKALIAITENMVKAGLEVMEQHINASDDITDHEEAPSDIQLIVAIFTRMWQVKMAEEEAVRQGKGPKLIKPAVNTLIMPRTH